MIFSPEGLPGPHWPGDAGHPGQPDHQKRDDFGCGQLHGGAGNQRGAQERDGAGTGQG